MVRQKEYPFILLKVSQDTEENYSKLHFSMNCLDLKFVDICHISEKETFICNL